jgi:hypothetical protein
MSERPDRAWRTRGIDRRRNRDIRRWLAVGAVVAALLAPATPAGAGWSPPRGLPVSAFDLSAVAVNPGGETAVAWATRSSPAVSPRYRTAIHVALRDRAGRVRTRVVWSSARHRADALAVTLDPRGEATVAWIARTRTSTGVVLAAYGNRNRPWTPARTVGGGISDLRAVVASDGEVLLTWAAGKVGYAVRSPGHRFHAPRSVNRPRAFGGLPRSGPLGVIPAYDTRGRAYLAGRCDAAVAIARPHTPRFTRTAILVSGPIVGMSFSVTGAGDGIAGWAAGACTQDEMVPATPGPVVAAALRGGRFVTAATLDPAARVVTTNAVAASGGGGTVTWGMPGSVFSAWLRPTGPAGPPALVPDGRIVLTADGGGDQVLSATPGGVLDFAPSDVAVRPVTGGPDEPAPLRGGVAVAVSAPSGRALAVMGQTAANVRALTVWQP